MTSSGTDYAVHPAGVGLGKVLSEPSGCIVGRGENLRLWALGDYQETHLLKPEGIPPNQCPLHLIGGANLR